MNTSNNENAVIATTPENAPDYSHLPQIHRELRGHEFYPDVAIPELYATEETKTADKIIYAKYFCAAGTWYVAEVEVETGLAFGYVELAAFPEGAEWGYINLPELEQILLTRMNGGGCIERDCHFTPTRFTDLDLDFL